MLDPQQFPSWTWGLATACGAVNWALVLPPSLALSHPQYSVCSLPPHTPNSEVHRHLAQGWAQSTCCAQDSGPGLGRRSHKHNPHSRHPILLMGTSAC